jgi:hypothetical protein
VTTSLSIGDDVMKKELSEAISKFKSASSAGEKLVHLSKIFDTLESVSESDREKILRTIQIKDFFTLFQMAGSHDARKLVQQFFALFPLIKIRFEADAELILKSIRQWWHHLVNNIPVSTFNTELQQWFSSVPTLKSLNLHEIAHPTRYSQPLRVQREHSNGLLEELEHARGPGFFIQHLFGSLTAKVPLLSGDTYAHQLYETIDESCSRVETRQTIDSIYQQIVNIARQYDPQQLEALRMLCISDAKYALPSQSLSAARSLHQRITAASDRVVEWAKKNKKTVISIAPGGLCFQEINWSGKGVPVVVVIPMDTPRPAELKLLRMKEGAVDIRMVSDVTILQNEEKLGAVLQQVLSERGLTPDECLLYTDQTWGAATFSLPALFSHQVMITRRTDEDANGLHLPVMEIQSPSAEPVQVILSHDLHTALESEGLSLSDALHPTPEDVAYRLRPLGLTMQEFEKSLIVANASLRNLLVSFKSTLQAYLPGNRCFDSQPFYQKLVEIEASLCISDENFCSAFRDIGAFKEYSLLRFSSLKEQIKSCIRDAIKAGKLEIAAEHEDQFPKPSKTETMIHYLMVKLGHPPTDSESLNMSLLHQTIASQPLPDEDLMSSGPTKLLRRLLNRTCISRMNLFWEISPGVLIGYTPSADGDSLRKVLSD